VSQNDVSANPVRGEAELCVGGARLVLRPSFQALVAAEGELGSLFALVERAAEGRMLLGEVAALLWHCVADRPEGLSRERVGQAVAELGLARTAPVLKLLIGQILTGRV
jgi:hypothetical protein